MADRAVLPALAYSKPSVFLPGWIDSDAAIAAGQFFGDGPPGALVVDSREILTSTARVVGSSLGELPLKVWMALVTLHVAFGSPADGVGETTVGHLGRLVWGNKLGGDNTRRLIHALIALRRADVRLPNYNPAKHKQAKGVGFSGLVQNVFLDDAIQAAFDGQHELDRHAFGKLLGAKGPGTITWQLNAAYVRALEDADLQRFDWSKVHQLRGVALALWLVFTSPRMPYRTLMEAPESEHVEIALTERHCRALGVSAATDAARRRTFNEAGGRVCRADSGFVAFEAHGGRGLPSFLRVVRRTQSAVVVLPAGSHSDHQLVLGAAA